MKPRTGGHRRRALLPAAGAAAFLVSALGSPPPARAGVPVVVISGAGWGHGVGMAQDGAYWMGQGGASTAAILAQFYPETRLALGGGAVRVVVADSPSAAVGLAFPAGGELRDNLAGSQSPGFPVTVPPGGQVLVRFDGTRYSVKVGATDAGTATLPATPVVNRSASAGLPLVPPAGGVAPATTATTPPVPIPTPGQPSPPSSTTTTAPSAATTAPPPQTTTTTTGPPPGTLGPEGSTATTATTLPPPTPLPPPPAAPAEPAASSPPPSSTRPVWALAGDGGTVAVPAFGRRYRGGLQAAAGSDQRSLRLVNQLDVEEYLRGMGEVLDPSWPPAALRAQAIAARTYALRAMASGDLCADQRCQVYLGQEREYPAMDRAVAETAGQVLTFEGNLASAVYSANGGGFSASREEGFGPAVVRFEAGFPYLRPARYPTRDRFPWSLTISMTDVAAELDYPGDLSVIAVTRAGPSGRALIVTVDGTSGPRTLSGVQFAAALGLRSTLFSLRATTAAELPAVRARSSDAGSPGAGAVLESTTAAPSSSAAGAVSPPPAGGSGESSWGHQANGGQRLPATKRWWYQWWWVAAPLLISRRTRMGATPARRRALPPRGRTRRPGDDPGHDG